MTLTAQEIVTEAAKILSTLPKTKARENLNLRTMAPAERKVQLHTDFAITPDDLELTLSEFTERYIRPCMVELATCVPKDVIFEELPLPEGCIDVASEKPLRVVIGETYTPIFPPGTFDREDWEEIEPIGCERGFVGRFDILFELA